MFTTTDLTCMTIGAAIMCIPLGIALILMKIQADNMYKKARKALIQLNDRNMIIRQYQEIVALYIQKEHLVKPLWAEEKDFNVIRYRELNKQIGDIAEEIVAFYSNELINESNAKKQYYDGSC